MISLIVAYSKNKVIGNNGVIPWKIKGEQKRFKELTTGNVVIMGRRSFEEIGKPLSNRRTIVITSNFEYAKGFDNCEVATNLKEAIQIAGNKDIYISGGALLYKEAIPLVDRMYVTEIDSDVDGDTYFPEFREEDFVKTYEERQDVEIPYTYITYERV